MSRKICQGSLVPPIGCIAAALLGVVLPGLPLAHAQQTQLPTTLDDFFAPGTQENTLTDTLLPVMSCRVCHEYKWDGNKDDVVAPFDNWAMSLMGQAARDTIWHAALAIANQDVNLA